MLDDKERFGQRLRELRLAAGLSQRKLAARSGLDLKCIQRYEYGQVMPREPNQLLLATALGVSIEDLHASGPIRRPPLDAASKCVTFSRTAALASEELRSLVEWMAANRVGVVTVLLTDAEVSMMYAHAKVTLPENRPDGEQPESLGPPISGASPHVAGGVTKGEGGAG